MSANNEETHVLCNHLLVLTVFSGWLAIFKIKFSLVFCKQLENIHSTALFIGILVSWFQRMCNGDTQNDPRYVTAGWPSRTADDGQRGRSTP